ncbi:putative mitochondria fission 1 protein [Helianthus anomalus]
MHLSWTLVHSWQPEDVQCSIAMLEASLVNTSSPLQKREKLYLLDVGYYRSGDFPNSKMLLEQVLEVYFSFVHYAYKKIKYSYLNSYKS